MDIVYTDEDSLHFCISLGRDDNFVCEVFSSRAPLSFTAAKYGFFIGYLFVFEKISGSILFLDMFSFRFSCTVLSYPFFMLLFASSLLIFLRAPHT